MESFETINKKISKTTEAIENFLCPKLQTDLSHQLAMENKQNETFTQPAIEKTQDQSPRGVLYDTSLENTLENVKKKNFLWSNWNPWKRHIFEWHKNFKSMWNTRCYQWKRKQNNSRASRWFYKHKWSSRTKIEEWW